MVERAATVPLQSFLDCIDGAKMHEDADSEDPRIADQSEQTGFFGEGGLNRQVLNCFRQRVPTG